MTGEGRKDDEGKLRWTLMPWDALTEVQKVVDYGAKKYGDENWRSLKLPRTRYAAAMFRHLIAYVQGETHDPESGLHHLAHAACSALFIIHIDIKEEP